MPTSPSAFCLRCRALLDAEQACDCDDKGARVELGDDSRDLIEQALRRVPHVDLTDSTQRLLFSLALGPGAVALVFLVLTALGLGSGSGWAALAWIFGLPFAVITLGWIGFFIASELEERRPFYPGARERALSDDSVLTATLESGRVDIVELRQDADEPVMIRDAVIEEDLELRLPGKIVIIPAGRCQVELPRARMRLAPHGEPVSSSWEHLPEELKRAGKLHAASLSRGVRVELIDGELEELPDRETTFREAAEDRVRFKPNGGRVRLRVVG